jgi:formylglycine-generating enzyme required for sulfatase activity
MGSNPSYFIGGNLPVEQISWYEAVDDCNARSVKEGLTAAYTVNGTNVTRIVGASGYRLPTEAEWEYACRAGTATAFHAGSSVTTAQANYNGSKTWNVGSGAPNTWGLYDMSGNVLEWCWDWYGAYSSAAQTDPTGAASGSYRVLCGGSYGSNAVSARSARRINIYPTFQGNVVGFQVVRP